METRESILLGLITIIVIGWAVSLDHEMQKTERCETRLEELKYEITLLNQHRETYMFEYNGSFVTMLEGGPLTTAQPMTSEEYKLLMDELDKCVNTTIGATSITMI